MKPFVKWAGGKEHELPIIMQNMPNDINNYIEPFLGGGALYFAMSQSEINGKFYVNDFSEELIQLYKEIYEQDSKFYDALKIINKNIKALKNISSKYSQDIIDVFKEYRKNKNPTSLRDKITNFMYKHTFEFNGLHEVETNVCIDDFDELVKDFLIRKIKRIIQLEEKNNEFDDVLLKDMIETSLLSAYYTHIRNIYNNLDNDNIRQIVDKSTESAYFYYIREYCYCSMFRYNRNGKFNVPYGGIAYNKKSLENKINYISSKELVNHIKNTEIYNLDFEAFFQKLKIDKKDFLFIDPPYDTDFNEYAKNSFGKEDQIRLARCLSNLKCRIMIIIKKTDFIYNLYNDLGFNIDSFEKKYNVNFRNRNERNVEHLLITNY